MGAFVQPDSHPVIYFIPWEILKFPHQFPIALENAVKSIELREPGKLVPILSPKYGYFFPSDSHPMVSPTPWKVHGFSHPELDLGVIGPRASNKNWAPMSISQYLNHSYTRKVIVATVKRKEDNKIMTRIRNQATQ